MKQFQETNFDPTCPMILYKFTGGPLSNLEYSFHRCDVFAWTICVGKDPVDVAEYRTSDDGKTGTATYIGYRSQRPAGDEELRRRAELLQAAEEIGKPLRITEVSVREDA